MTVARQMSTVIVVRETTSRTIIRIIAENKVIDTSIFTVIHWAHKYVHFLLGQSWYQNNYLHPY